MNILNQKDNELQKILQLVSFKLGSEEFGINILNVKEINRMVNITAIPNSPAYVEGIINLRGKIISVIDLRTKLGMPKRDPDNETRIMVVDVQGRTTGFLLDGVSEVLSLPANLMESPPEITAGINSKLIKAVGKLEDKILILLDLEKVLSKSEELELQPID
jgi:purine-binding chemotaxis protein CheW